MRNKSGAHPGHIRGTSSRHPPGSVENCRDLNCRSGNMPTASAEVRDTQAQDPAYRPTRPSQARWRPLEAFERPAQRRARCLIFFDPAQKALWPGGGSHTGDV